MPVTVAVITAVILQVVLPNRLTLGQRFVLPSLETMLVIGLVAVNPRRIQRRSRPLRLASMGLIALISLANAWAAGQLIRGLIQGTEGSDAGPLLATGAAIWATNIIVFALWYWELDRGGPSARAAGERQHADFLFPQMANPELGPPDWEPQFVDYLYLSFTNATAFSPTDVMPLTRWTKMLMLVQSAVSLVTIALVIARAVNILK